MDIALMLARLLLAVVFAVAGVAKLVDREGSREGMQGFGLPALLATPVAILVPLAELVVAALLLPKATAWWGALGALALLAIFIMAIGYNLARGRHPECHCFGQLHSAPASGSTLARNGLLAAIALFVVGFGRDLFSFSNDDAGASVIAWTDDLSAWALAATVVGALALMAMAAEGWLLIHLLAQNGRILLRLDALEGGEIAPQPAQPEVEGLPVGTVAPPFALKGLHGETLTLDALRAAGKPLLLLFSDPDCGPCNVLLPEVGQWQREHAAELTIALISRGSAEVNRSKVTEHGITNVLLQKDGKVAKAYEAVGTPTAVLIQPDGTIGSPVAGGASEVRKLVAELVATQSPEALVAWPEEDGVDGNDDTDEPTRIGEPAADVSLPDLTGRTVRLSDFRGHPTLVLFWSPSCGFCQHMLPDLKAWEAAPPPNAPRLLVVSAGTIGDNRKLGLRSPIVLDQDFTTGWAFGASGTPSAVLVDAGGRIASDVAVGAAEVLTLARMEQRQAQETAA